MMQSCLKYGWGVSIIAGWLVIGIPLFTDGMLCDGLNYSLRWIFVVALACSILLFPFWLIRKWALVKVELWGCSALVGLGLGFALFLGIGLFRQELKNYLLPKPKLYEDECFVVRKNFRDTFETKEFPVLVLYQKKGMLEYCICEDVLSQIPEFDLVDACTYIDMVNNLKIESVQELKGNRWQMVWTLDGFTYKKCICMF